MASAPLVIVAAGRKWSVPLGLCARLLWCGTPASCLCVWTSSQEGGHCWGSPWCKRHLLHLDLSGGAWGVGLTPELSRVCALQREGKSGSKFLLLALLLEWIRGGVLSSYACLPCGSVSYQVCSGWAVSSLCFSSVRALEGAAKTSFFFELCPLVSSKHLVCSLFVFCFEGKKVWNSRREANVNVIVPLLTF